MTDNKMVRFFNALAQSIITTMPEQAEEVRETGMPPQHEMDLIEHATRELIARHGCQSGEEVVKTFFDLAYSGKDERFQPRFPRIQMEKLVYYVRASTPEVWHEACDHFGLRA